MAAVVGGGGVGGRKKVQSLALSSSVRPAMSFGRSLQEKEIVSAIKQKQGVISFD